MILTLLYLIVISRLQLNYKLFKRLSTISIMGVVPATYQGLGYNKYLKNEWKQFNSACYNNKFLKNP